MKLLKIEIIIANTFLQPVINLLEEAEVHGYSALDISRGKGTQRGEQLAEGLLPTTRNSLIFTIANKQVADKVIETVQPFLDQRGGILITTEINYASGYK